MLLLLLEISLADCCWLQPARVQNLGVLLVEDLTELRSLTTSSHPSLKRRYQNFYLGFTLWIIPESILNHTKVFRGRMSKFELKLHVDSLNCSLGHFECGCHTVHNFSQWRVTVECLAHVRVTSRIHSKVSSGWLTSYIKVTRAFLEISKWLDIFRADLVFLRACLVLWSI